MDAAAWIALATLAFLFVLQAVSFAFVLGGLFQRVRGLEGELEKSSDCTAALAALNATMTALKERIETLERSVRDALPAARPLAREARG